MPVKLIIFTISSFGTTISLSLLKTVKESRNKLKSFATIRQRKSVTMPYVYTFDTIAENEKLYRNTVHTVEL